MLLLLHLEMLGLDVLFAHILLCICMCVFVHQRVFSHFAVQKSIIPQAACLYLSPHLVLLCAFVRHSHTNAPNTCNLSVFPFN